MKTITTDELKTRLDRETTALFDVRGDVLFEQGHIPSAMTAPLGSLVFRVVRVMNPDSFVAVYASGEDDLAEQAAKRLTDLQMTNVHVYREGLRGWQADGNPVVESKHPKKQTQGEVAEARGLVVDRANSYGGAFAGVPSSEEGAGG
jgi:rhodanese-related sulfurtransferase